MSTHRRKMNIYNIVKFFDLIMVEQNASREEVTNFLQDCLKFVFDYHNLDINDFNITFHNIKMDKYADYSAFMEAKRTRKNSLQFDVYFNYDEMVFKVQQENDHIKKSHLPKGLAKNSLEEHYSQVNYLKKPLQTLFSLMFTAMHEFGHIIQYVEHYRHMKKAIIREIEVANKFNKNLLKAKTEKQNLLIKQFERHQTALESISNIERNADYQAYKYCQILFRTMYYHEENETIKNFYLMAIHYFNKIRKNRYHLYRISDKDNKQAISILNKNGIKKEDLLNK